jgi:uncharacterized GH25 family protein
MSMRKKLIFTLLAFSLPLVAQAHRNWLLPSSTVLAGNASWVTVDAAASNDLFYLDHNSLRIENLQIVGPDGALVKAENVATGRYRNTFDIRLEKTGTYKVAIFNETMTANFKVKGEAKRWRGALENMAKEIPADAEELSMSQAQSRTETFVTLGKPSDTVLKTSGVALELAPITHPNDFVAGETAKLRLLLDGKPAAGMKVVIVPGGVRYRDKLNDWEVLTDQEGVFSVKWPQPGMYWFNSFIEDERSTVKGAKRRAGYSATVEVLAP